MDYFISYQDQDTLKVKNLNDIHLQVKPPVSLNVKPSLISAEKLRIDTAFERKRKISKPETTKVAIQKNSVRTRAEQIALADSSSIIKPQTEVSISTLQPEPVGEIILPERKLNNTNLDWITIILLTNLIIFASIRKPFANYLSHLFKSTFNYPTSTRMFRERSYSLVDGAFRLDIYFYFIFSLFVYQAFIYLKVDLPVQSFSLFLYCIAGVLGYFVFKRLVYLMIGFVNKGQEETIEYLFNLNNYNRVLGLLLTPIVVIIAFSPIFNSNFFVIIGLILVIFFYGMSLQRGVLILLKKQFSIFYLFLYLCSLEILPLLLIFKMVLV
ncbi:MAG: DUF4271 domain-containing protein [Prolixibacteraceae bacterium]|nr:DUF4271 domain-containing protein [Prolixibacteraceae bacterium]MBN2775323.1 DUF4271 domain-containing protein [Prolixibacteraceae bacterium]